MFPDAIFWSLSWFEFVTDILVMSLMFAHSISCYSNSRQAAIARWLERQASKPELGFEFPRQQFSSSRCRCCGWVPLFAVESRGGKTWKFVDPAPAPDLAVKFLTWLDPANVTLQKNGPGRPSMSKLFLGIHTKGKTTEETCAAPTVKIIYLVS